MRAAILAFALAGLFPASCGGPSRPPADRTLVIDKMAYGPAPEGLRVGDTVVWSNKDVLQHSATARDGSFDLDLPPGATRNTVLTHPGMVNVFCRYHPDMKLRLEVEPNS